MKRDMQVLMLFLPFFDFFFSFFFLFLSFSLSQRSTLAYISDLQKKREEQLEVTGTHSANLSMEGGGGEARKGGKISQMAHRHFSFFRQEAGQWYYREGVGWRGGFVINGDGLLYLAWTCSSPAALRLAFSFLFPT